MLLRIKRTSGIYKYGLNYILNDNESFDHISELLTTMGKENHFFIFSGNIVLDNNISDTTNKLFIHVSPYSNLIPLNGELYKSRLIILNSTVDTKKYLKSSFYLNTVYKFIMSGYDQRTIPLKAKGLILFSEQKYIDASAFNYFQIIN